MATSASISYNITAYQGSDISFNISLLDENKSAINLSGYAVRGQVRSSYASSGILLDLNPIIYNNESGIISININGETSSLLPVGEFVYDIEKYPVNPPGEILKVLRGKFSLLPEVTR